MLVECGHIKKWNENSWVNSVRHFHCSGKNEKQTYELQNTNCAISVTPHMKSMFLQVKLAMHKIKIGGKISY